LTTMSFRLRDDEPIVRGMRRLASKELRSARRGLRQSSPPSDEAIHEARTSVKKVRAIASVFDADHGRGVSSQLEHLRRVNRKLSAARDATARLETLAKLKQHAPEALDEHTFARLRRKLEARKEESKQAASGALWKRVSRRLRRLRSGVGD